MKEKLKKIALTILAVMIAFNGIICFDKVNVVQADVDLDSELNSMDGYSKNWGEDLADVLLGIVLYIPKAMTFAIVTLIRTVVWLISAIDQNGASALSLE